MTKHSSGPFSPGAHVAITGASSGIGAGLVRHCAKLGAKVTLVARRRELMEGLAAEFPDVETYVTTADLCDVSSATAWIEAAEEALGPIDVLVNNAGMQYVEPALEVSDERTQRMFALNVLSPMSIGRHVARAMVARGRGAVVNIASVAATTPTPRMAHYSASKAALASWSEVLRGEVADLGVVVLTVYPGPVSTPMEKAAREKVASSMLLDKMPIGNPEELAQEIDKALQSQAPRLVYPSIYGATRLFPAAAQWFTERLAPKHDG